MPPDVDRCSASSRYVDPGRPVTSRLGFWALAQNLETSEPPPQSGRGSLRSLGRGIVALEQDDLSDNLRVLLRPIGDGCRDLLRPSIDARRNLTYASLLALTSNSLSRFEVGRIFAVVRWRSIRRGTHRKSTLKGRPLATLVSPDRSKKLAA